jgi:hypothetical protein
MTATELRARAEAAESAAEDSPHLRAENYDLAVKHRSGLRRLHTELAARRQLEERVEGYEHATRWGLADIVRHVMRYPLMPCMLDMTPMNAPRFQSIARGHARIFKLSLLDSIGEQHVPGPTTRRLEATVGALEGALREAQEMCAVARAATHAAAADRAAVWSIHLTRYH